MANHYDLLVWDNKNHPDIHSLRPAGLHFIYSNYNNVGPQDPISWSHFKQWADSHITDSTQYENMFIHMRNDHTKRWSYNDDSFDQYFDRCWMCNSSSQHCEDVSKDIRDKSLDIKIFPSSGSILYLGMTEGRFREINFALARNGSGLSIRWQYWNGSTWSALPKVDDGTDNLSRSGKVSFFAPVDWTNRLFNTDITRAYYVRGIASAVSSSPHEMTILSEDYASLIDGLFCIKGWDPANDLNGDGFVDDDEFLSLVNKNATARFRYQSRHAYGDSPQYYGRRWVLNVGNDDVSGWNQQWIPYLLSHQNGKDNGIFEDNALLWTEYAPNNFFWEFNTSAEWYDHNGKIWAKLKAASNPSLLDVNIANLLNNPAIDQYGADADILETESWLEGNVDLYERRLNETKKRSTVLKVPTLLEARVGRIDGSEDRNRIFTLATYYLQSYDFPNGPTFYYYGGRNYRNKDNRVYNWFGAIEYDVGKPLSDYYVLDSGKDVEKSTLVYKVFAREFSKALILAKPLPAGMWNGSWQTGNTSQATATTHSLPHTYRVLNADGTLGESISSVSLRNNEAVILISDASPSSPTNSRIR